MDTSLANEPTISTVVPVQTRLKRSLKMGGWISFALVCLTVFTVLKLPEDRIRNFVHGNIAALLAPRGIGFSAAQGGISLGLGLSYVMKDVTMTFGSGEAPTKIERISFSPSVIPAILGRQGGSLRVDNKEGSLSSSFWVKQTQFSVDFKAKALDIGKLGLLPIFAGIKGSAVLNGNGDISGDSAALSGLNGDVTIKIGKLVIDQQSLYGFAIPRLNISEGTIELSASKGKAVIKKLQLGKAGDDIQATLTGDVTLAKTIDSSTLNAKAKFTLSETVLKAFTLIDALLGAGKQADGSYAFNLTGPLSSPLPLPATQ